MHPVYILASNLELIDGKPIRAVFQIQAELMSSPSYMAEMPLE